MKIRHTTLAILAVAREVIINLADETRPETVMTGRYKTLTEQKAHLAAIENIVNRWMAGELTLAGKREAVAAENAFYYGRERQSRYTGTSLTTVVEELPAQQRVPAGEPDWDEDEYEEPWWQK
jgi:hypothetical protein